MTLQEWMTAEQLTDADVAQLSGYHRTFIWKLRTGRRPASRAAIQKFIELSSGRITSADFFDAVSPQ